MNLLQLISFILNNPELSNVRIGRLCRASSRTVCRYRRRVAQATAVEPLSELDLSDERRLRRRLNQPRYTPPTKTEIDWAETEKVLSQPNVTLRDAWENYRANRPRPHLSCSRFRRKVRARLGRTETRWARKPGVDPAAENSLL